MKRSIINSLRNYFEKVLFSSARLIVPVLIILGMTVQHAEGRSSPLPVVKVRFANFEYSCATKTMCVDVEFQCDSAMKQMFLMNVRFFYDDSKLEFISFGEYANGYGPVEPNPPYITTGNASSGPTLFGFTGAAEYVNGAVKKINPAVIQYISTDGWTKLFNVCFTVEDPAPTSGEFCPSLVWDLQEDPTLGGFLGNEGVVVTLAVGTDSSTPCAEEVVQYNWKYDGLPGTPYGMPDPAFCVVDNIPPTLTPLPEPTTIECPAVPNFATPTASDDCSTPLLTSEDVITPGVCAQEYSITRTWTATDDAGNTATVSQTFNITDNAPPTISTLPALNPVECPNTPVFTTPVATDLCDPNPALTFVDNTTPGACPQEYTITRTWTATDACGNSVTATQSVSITDNLPPVITPPADALTLSCFDATLVKAWTDMATATDACAGTVSVSASYTPPANNCSKTVTVTFTATDACGNTGSTTKNFTVDDKIAPVVTPPEAALNLSCYNAGQVAAWAATASATDNCGGTLTVTPSYTPPGDNCDEVITVTFTATDACGNTGTTTKSFTVDDNTPPVITPPVAALTISCFDAAVVKAWTDLATANDACSGTATVTANYTPPGDNCDETVIVTFTATDACGNTGSTTKSFTVDDNTPPLVTCPQVAGSYLMDEGQDYYTTKGTEFDATASDVCGLATLTHNLTHTSSTTLDGYRFPRGRTTVTWTATDKCGNTAACSFTVNVSDEQAPQLNCPPAPAGLQCAGDVPAPLTTWTAFVAAGGSATDNEGINEASFTYLGQEVTGQTCTNRFTLTRTYRIADNGGLTDICTQSITVNDITPPLVTLPPASLAMECFNVTTLNAWLNTASAADNCGGQIPVIASYAQPNDNCDEVVTVTFTATDACGNSASATKSFTIDDNTPPVITPPAAALTLSCFDASVVKVWTDQATANDACSGAVSVTAEYTTPADNCDETVTVTFTATDACGNIARTTGSFTVDDNTPPLVTCPQVAASYLMDTGQDYYTARGKEFDATASDVCRLATLTHNLTHTSSTTLSGYQFPRGSTLVTWTATDNCGNTALCSITVIVSDEQPPVLNCPPAITDIQCAGDLPAPLTTWTAFVSAGGSATDNEGINEASFTYLGQVISDQTCANRFVATRTYRIADNTGLTDVCTQTITVNDVTPPVVTAPPATLSMACFNVVTLNAWLNTASAEDNCGGQIQVIANYDQPTDNCDEVITVTFTATDACGNTGSTTKSFTVDDNLPPVVTAPPATLAMSCFNPTTLNAWLNTASAEDNCGGQIEVIANYDQPTDNCDEVITVTFTATDACGNTGSTTKSFTVDDNTPPVINCPQVSASYQTDPGQTYYTAQGTEFNAITSDGCGLATITHNLTHTSATSLAGYRFPEGSTQVTWTAVDNCGNTASCSITVVVNEEQPPVLICPEQITGVQCADDLPAPYTTWIQFVAAGGSATDADGINTASFTYLGQEILPMGCTDRFVMTRTYRIADNTGLTDICSQMITVYDEVPPVIDCPANQSFTLLPGQAEYDWAGPVNPAVSDNCTAPQNIILAGVRSDGRPLSDPWPAGITSITWNAEDACGNVAEPCIQTITVSSVYADLQVEKAVSNPNPSVNEVVAFNLQVTNNGPVNATGVVMSDILPSGYTYVSDNSGGSFDPVTGIWTIGNLTVGQSRSLSVNASVNESGDYLNLASVTGNQPDPNTENNRDSVIIRLEIEPQFLADTIFTCQDTPASGLILDGIAGLPPGEWNFPADSISGPYHGELTVSDEGVYDYMPAPGYFGMDTAMVQICNADTCLTDTMLFFIYEQIIADAGQDMDLCGTTTVQLHSLEYPGALVQWLQANGPSQALITYDTIPSPVVSGLIPGTYIFELFMVNGLCFANDSVTVTIWEPPVAQAGDDAVICSSEGSYKLNGMGVNATSLHWVTTGTGTFDDPSLPDALYTPSMADIEDGQVQLILTADGYPGCESHSDFMVLSIWKQPRVYAGANAYICSGGSYQVSDAWADGFDQVSWRHNGAGTLEGAGHLVPTYVSAPGEKGRVTLILTATPLGGEMCGAVSDTMVIDISNMPDLVCPVQTSFTFNATPGLCGYQVTDRSLDALVSGACGKVTIDHDFLACGCSGTLQGAILPIGTTIITWHASDDLGFSKTCQITVTVKDNQPPEFVNCPSGKVFTVGLFSHSCTGGTIWSIPVARDNCSTVTVTQVSGPAQGTILEVGTYAITYQATDKSGNTALCSFTINMIDTQDPLLVCPPNVTIAADPGSCTWASPPGSLSLMLASSNCPFNLKWEVKNPDGSQANGTGDVSGFIFQPGTSIITYVITEPSSGKSTYCTFSVKVTDGQKPAINCPEPLLVKTSPGDCDATVTLTLPAVTDNCQFTGTMTYKVFGPDNSIKGPFASTALTYKFMKGISQVEWTATDKSGNAATCRQEVNVWVNPADILVSAGPDETICEGETFTLAGSSASFTKRLLWETSGSGEFSDKTLLKPVYHPSQADILNGMVRLTLTGSSDCAVKTDEMVLTITGYPEVNAGPDVTLCHGEVLYITEAEAENTAQVSWVTSGTGTLANANTLKPVYTPAPTESGILRFILTGTGKGGCGDVTVKDTMYVSIVKPLIVKASDDIRILSGRTTILSVEVEDGSGFYSYLWMPENKVYTSNTNRTETMPLTETTTFEVTVTDDVTGCSAKDQVTVTVVSDIDELITIYNGVSPNGDGANDVWLIDGIELFPDNEAMIFNRWGDEIKKFKAYDNVKVVWDATNKQDKLVPDGTYYYVLKIRDIKTYTGWIQVKSGF